MKNLGEGGYGTVYLIQHPTWGRIAFKKFTISSDSDLIGMKKEADIHKNLHHPNILRMFDAQFDSEVCGLFLEYMEYGPVDEFLQDFKVNWVWKLQILHDVASAMSYLHNHQPVIIHGDLKCQNILIGCGYHAKISDFGMAHIRLFSNSENTHNCRTGCGTLEYIAPEYLKDPQKKKSEPFDVYGFAISAWEIFSQKHPYYDFSDPKLISVFIVDKGWRPDVADIRDSIPLAVVSLIRDCWHQDEQSRPTFKNAISIISDQLCLLADDLRRIPEFITNEESVEPIANTTGSPAIILNTTQKSEEIYVGSSLATNTEIQSCVSGFRKVLSSLSLYLDPEYGLLPCLKFKGIITDVEYRLLEDFKSDPSKTYIDLNYELLLKYIDPNIESCCLKFFEALKENDQQHIVLYIKSGGEVADYEDRVLNRDEIAMIDDNIFCLVKLIDPFRSQFLYKLVSKQCITYPQQEKIKQIPDIVRKGEELLKIMKRRTYKDFRNFKMCLHDTMQHKLVDILEKGGIVTVRVKLQKREDRKVIESKLIKLVTGYVDETDEIDKTLTPEQVEFIKELLKELEEFDIQLIGNSAWRSIAVFFKCKTEHSFVVFERLYTSGQLKVILERLFRCLLRFQEDQSELIKEVSVDLNQFDSERRNVHTGTTHINCI